MLTVDEPGTQFRLEIFRSLATSVSEGGSRPSLQTSSGAGREDAEIAQLLKASLTTARRCCGTGRTPSGPVDPRKPRAQGRKVNPLGSERPPIEPHVTRYWRDPRIERGCISERTDIVAPEPVQQGEAASFKTPA